jgi:hypothetical protein
MEPEMNGLNCTSRTICGDSVIEAEPMADETRRVERERASGYSGLPEPKLDGIEQGVYSDRRAGREPAWGHSPGTCRGSRTERAASMQRASSVHIGSSVLKPRNEVWAGLVEFVRTFLAYVFMLVFSILWWALVFKMACGEQTVKRALVVVLMVFGYFFLLGLIVFLAVPLDEWRKEFGK